MFDCHQTEQSFWRTMNPARLHALFDAYFRQHRPRAGFGAGSPPQADTPGRPELYELFP